MPLQREQVVQTAEKYVSRGKIEPAIREYKKLLAENPNDINTLNRVGDLYAKIHRVEEAIDFFTQIAERYTAEGFFVKAIAIYKKIIKLDPTRLEVYEKLAELYHKQGLVNEARTQYQVLADYYQKHDNAASAIAIYLKMTELEPENPSYHVKLAEIYQQQQLIEKAMGEYRIIAELMINHGHAQEAAQVYERALDVDSRSVGFIRDAVRRLETAGHHAGAARLLSLAVERNPAAREVHLAGAEPEPQEMPREVIADADSSPELVVEDFQPALQADGEDLYDSMPMGGPSLMERLAELTPAEDDDAFGRLDDDLASAMRAAASSVPGTSQSPAQPAAAADGDEIELDLDEVFVLDFAEDDDEPASLVKPPADMLDDQPRRPAWALASETASETPVPASQPAAAPEPEPSFEPSFDAEPALSWQATQEAAEAAEEVELELDLDFDNLSFGETDVPAMSPVDVPPPAPASEEPAEEAPIVLEELHLEPMDFNVGLEDFELSAPAALEGAPEAAPAATAPMDLDHDLLERTAAELDPRQLDRDEDLVAEAEVLAKYGLEEKALERLREALRLRPRHLEAYALMIQIHLDKGRHVRVLEVANQMASVAAQVGDGTFWPKVRRRLADAGYRVEGDHVAAAPRGRKDGDEAVQDLLKGLLDKPARKAPSRPAAEAAPPPPAQPPSPTVAPEPPPPVAAAAFSPPPQPAPPPRVERPGIFNPLEIGELVEAEDLDEPTPFVAPSAGTAGMPPMPPMSPAGGDAPPPWLVAMSGASVAPSTSGSQLDDSGMSWLDESNGRSQPQESGGLFDEDDDFFDLAGELEQELSQEDIFQDDTSLMPAEQSLEEIVEGFKKGVAEHLSPTDYDTHFNLGIAYREMGLLDEAIGEFQLASKSPGHLVSCCSMLGLCFLDKGLPELAIKWYQRGLSAPNVSEEDSLGLLYDLGNVYLSIGDNPTAYRTYVELYGINSNYRDVVAKLEELGRSR